MESSFRVRAQRAIDGFYAFLDRPLYFWSRPALIALVVPLLFGLAAPLWRIQMEAPQYPEGLAVDIYAHKIESGHDNNDLREINILNHYIGMKKIDRAELSDLDWLPFGLGVLAILLLRCAVVGNVRSLVDFAVMVGYFSCFSLGRFAYRLYTYGHNLSPDAPVKVTPFMPALLGSKQVGNFTTHSYPQLGTFLIGIFAFGVLSITLIHLVVGRRRATREAAVVAPAQIAAPTSA